MLPLLVIGGAALLLGFVVKKTPAATGTTSPSNTSSGTEALSAPILKNGQTLGAAVPPLAYVPPIYTNHPAGKLLGVFEVGPTGPSEEFKALAVTKQAIGLAKTAVNVTVQAAQAAGVVIGEAVSQAIPLVNTVVGAAMAGLSFAQAGQAKTKEQKGNLEFQGTTSAFSAIPVVGVVTVAITIPKLFESIADAKIARQRIVAAKHDQAKSYSDVGSWLPRGVNASDRLDEWYLLPRLTDAAQITWATQANKDSEAYVSAFPQTVSVAMDHLRYGEMGRGASEGIVLVPPRDVKKLEEVLATALQDAFILNMATADFLNRKGRPYKISMFEQGSYLPQQTASWAGFTDTSASGFVSPNYFGVVPGAVAMGPSGGVGVPVPLAPSLSTLLTKTVPPRMLERLVQYWEAADVIKFHGSSLYRRIVASRALTTLDDIAPLPPSPGPSLEQVAKEIATLHAQITPQFAALVEKERIAAELYYQQQSASAGGM